MLTMIDTDQINRLIPHLDAMVDEGLIAMSRVEVIRYFHHEGLRSQVTGFFT